jgi:hypothetical protein
MSQDRILRLGLFTFLTLIPYAAFGDQPAAERPVNTIQVEVKAPENNADGALQELRAWTGTVIVPFVVLIIAFLFRNQLRDAIGDLSEFSAGPLMFRKGFARSIFDSIVDNRSPLGTVGQDAVP